MALLFFQKTIFTPLYGLNSKSLIVNDCTIENYTKEELMEAMPPLISIIRKSEKAQRKFAEGTPSHTRLKKIIDTMNISKSLITEEIGKRG